MIPTPKRLTRLPNRRTHREILSMEHHMKDSPPVRVHSWLLTPHRRVWSSTDAYSRVITPTNVHEHPRTLFTHHASKAPFCVFCAFLRQSPRRKKSMRKLARITANQCNLPRIQLPPDTRNHSSRPRNAHERPILLYPTQSDLMTHHHTYPLPASGIKHRVSAVIPQSNLAVKNPIQSNPVQPGQRCKFALPRPNHAHEHRFTPLNTLSPVKKLFRASSNLPRAFRSLAQRKRTEGRR
jgi:hypothetical protein